MKHALVNGQIRNGMIVSVEGIGGKTLVVSKDGVKSKSLLPEVKLPKIPNVGEMIFEKYVDVCIAIVEKMIEEHKTK